eukprot:591823-Hanusia_phi.AAC.1
MGRRGWGRGRGGGAGAEVVQATEVGSSVKANEVEAGGVIKGEGRRREGKGGRRREGREKRERRA